MESSVTPLGLDRKARAELWKVVAETIESYWQAVEQLPVSPSLDLKSIRQFAESFTFETPLEANAALRTVASELVKGQVHTAHPQYFGLFNPAPAAMSIAADALVAALNPQLAAWSHSPAAVEIERHVVRELAAKLGFPRESSDGVFAGGGAEANQTAVLAALAHRWPEINAGGLRSLQEEPVFYVSAEGHHTFARAARTAGLGSNSLREIAVADDLKIDLNALEAAIQQDRASGYSPFLLVGTAGTTAAGVVDPLPALADFARRQGLWFHVDAAWGGAAALAPKLRPVLDGIEQADSITFDAHKWLSVPMGAGIFLTRHPEILHRVFTIETAYMPKEGARMQVTDPYSHSIQWSRRFIGLKLFLSLAVAGWDGYAAAIGHQAEMGDLLRKRLLEDDWKIVNCTPLPLACFTDARAEWDLAACQRIADAVVSSGQAWISTVQLGRQKRPALRARITNYRTEPRHIEALLTVLNRERRSIAAS